MVVVDERKNVLTRSAAVIYVMKRLGGLWAVLGAFFHLVPRAVRDLIYDAVASLRIKFLATTAEACPMAPPALRERFLH